jgi:hypothetical protein
VVNSQWSALSGQPGLARQLAVSKAQALPNGAPGSRHALAIPRTVRQDHRNLATARPRTILVSDSVLDELAADLALVRGYAPDGTTYVSTLSESGVGGDSVVIESTSRPATEQQSDDSTPRLESLVMAAGFSGFAANLFAARKWTSKSKKEKRGRS